ncbi:MAG: hypothetical protein U0V73_08875 [Acidimicrobiia bacterium]
MHGLRACRVRPDLPAVDKTFDYLVPDGLDVTVGTIVRVPLHGRRVRGWVVADDVEPDTDPARLRPLLRVSSAGPPAEVMALCDWVAWRYAGSPVPVLRAASPPRNVARAVTPPGDAPADGPRGGSGPVARGGPSAGGPVELWAWPPAADRRDLVRSHLVPSGSTIVVTPDGPRTAMLARELEAAGRRVVVLRADLADARRAAEWDAARRGRCVVLGGRLAVFAPVPDLGAVMVLDEGDESLQEERAPTWHARDVAAERARRAGVPLTLVSPVPSLEAEALVPEPARRRPSRSVERDGWPWLAIVDRRDEPPGLGLFSKQLVDASHAAIDGGGRAVCVLNRKGRARLLVCAACDALATCERCAAGVVETDGSLRCPRCATERPRVCLRCHGARLKALRPGVSKVRDDLDALLPRADVVEVDAATGAVPVADVLVGTEAVLHRVPRSADRPVRLVAFLEFDQELLAARYRATEQALWLLVRGARLLGPRARGGRLLVQTRVPDHEVLRAVQHADPTVATGAERERRRALGFPPFGALAELSGEPDAVAFAADALRGPDLTVLGPTMVGVVSRALVRAPSDGALATGLASVSGALRGHGRLRVAVDPPRV